MTETSNPVANFEVAVLLDDMVVSLPKRNICDVWRYLTFLFLADARNICTVVVMDQAVNLGLKGAR